MVTPDLMKKEDDSHQNSASIVLVSAQNQEQDGGNARMIG